MSKPSQPCLSNFVSKLVNLSCHSDVLLCYTHFEFGPSWSLHTPKKNLPVYFWLLSFFQNCCIQTIHHSRSHDYLVTFPFTLFHYWCCPYFTNHPRHSPPTSACLHTPLQFSCVLFVALDDWPRYSNWSTFAISAPYSFTVTVWAHPLEIHAG